MTTYPDRLLDVNAAAELLSVAPKTVRKWVYERRLPVVKLRGTAVRLRLSDLEKIIRADTVPALRPLAERQRAQGD